MIIQRTTATAGRRVLVAMVCILVAALPVSMDAAPSRAAAGFELIRPGTLTVGIDPPSPPMESLNQEARTVIGVDPSLAAALADRLGLRLAFVQVVQFDTLIPRLNRREYDVIITSMRITPQRQRFADFVPYMVVGESIVVASGNLKRVLSLGDLSGLNASVSAATPEGDAVRVENRLLAARRKPLILLKTYDDANQALIELMRGQSDAYLADYPVAAYHVAQSAGGIGIAGEQFDVSTYGIAVRKSDRGLFAALARALRAMRGDGTYRQILARFSVDAAALS